MNSSNNPTQLPGFYLVVAMDQNGGIGKDNALPWKLSQDMKFFKAITCTNSLQATLQNFGIQKHSETHSQALIPNNSLVQSIPSKNLNAVIMGRNTWESLPQKFKPLPGRLNIILSQSQAGTNQSKGGNSPSEELWANNFETALEITRQNDCPYVFVIGGGQVYRAAGQHANCKGIIYTFIHKTFPCDTYFTLANGENFSTSLKLKEESIKSPIYQEQDLEFSFNFLETSSLIGR